MPARTIHHPSPPFLLWAVHLLSPPSILWLCPSLAPLVGAFPWTFVDVQSIAIPWLRPLLVPHGRRLSLDICGHTENCRHAVLLLFSHRASLLLSFSSPPASPLHFSLSPSHSPPIFFIAEPTFVLSPLLFTTPLPSPVPLLCTLATICATASACICVEVPSSPLLAPLLPACLVAELPHSLISFHH